MARRARGCAGRRHWHRPRRARALPRGDRQRARAGSPRRARERRTHERATPLLPARPRAARRGIARRARPDRPIDVLTHPAFARLHPTGVHPERPERLSVLLEHFDNWTEGRAASEDDVRLCHTSEHIAHVRAVESPEWLDFDTMANDSTYEAAMLSARTAIEAAPPGGFAPVRPPGHPALRGRPMAFC